MVFHFNPRFPEEQVVRNSNLGGYWGPEERDGGFPFVPGRQFEVRRRDTVILENTNMDMLSKQLVNERRGMESTPSDWADSLRYWRRHMLTYLNM